MAISARFEADFSSFQNAVRLAQDSLIGFQSGAAKVEKSLTRLTDGFSGRKVIQDATLMAEAVERVGGTSYLTANELARVNRVADEAAAKLKAMGAEVPPGIARITSEVKASSTALDKMKGIASTMAGALGIGLSIGAVVSFGRAVFDSAGQVHDLALQLGISTDAVQGFKYAAEQSGSSIDAVGTALTRMNVNLSEGSSGTVGALTAAGLKFEDIRRMKPEDAFLAIADGIRQIPDPMLQSEVALQLFGKSAAQLLPGIKEGFRDVSDGASKMSADTIRDLEKAGDAWASLYNEVKIFSGKLIAGLMADGRRWSDWVTSLYKSNPFNAAIGEAAKSMNVWSDNAKRAADIKPPVLLTGSGAAQILSADAALAQLTQELGTHRETTVRTTVASTRHTEAVKAFSLAVTNDMIPVVKRLGTEIAVVIPKMADFGYHLKVINGIPFGSKVGEQVDIAVPKVEEARSSVMELAGAFMQFGGIARGSIGTAVGSIGSMTSAIASANAGFAGTLSLMATAFQVGQNLQGLLGLRTGKLGALLGTNASGRSLVNEYAEIMGGYDALHAQLLRLGDDGEALWIKLTQGVGRSNPEQARKAIEDVQRALDTLGSTVVEPRINPRYTPIDLEQFEGMVPSFAQGSGGLRNFGAGQLAMLHGVEEVVTPAGPGGSAALHSEIAGLRSDMARRDGRLRDELYLALRDAMAHA